MKAATATDSSHVAAVITRLMTFVQHTSACLGARTCRECECGAAKAIDDAKNIACSLAAVLPASAPSLLECIGCHVTNKPLVGYTIERKPGPFCADCWKALKTHVADVDAASAPSRPLEELMVFVDEHIKAGRFTNRTDEFYRGWNAAFQNVRNKIQQLQRPVPAPPEP